MSKSKLTRCPFAREVISVGEQSAEKSKYYPHLATPYGQVSLEMTRILHRHTETCGICRSEMASMEAA